MGLQGLFVSHKAIDALPTEPQNFIVSDGTFDELGPRKSSSANGALFADQLLFTGGSSHDDPKPIQDGGEEEEDKSDGKIG